MAGVIRFGAGCLGVLGAMGAVAQVPGSLLDGVSNIAAPGIPGPVSVVGAEAFCVVPCNSDGAQAAAVAAGPAGNGRVVAWSHNGYLGKGALEAADTGLLMLNVVRWVGRSATPRVAVADAGELADYLEAKGLSVSRTRVRELEAEMPRADVICLDAHQISSTAQLERLEAFLRGGGGIVTAATGWGWIQLNPGHAMNREFLGNALLVRAGLAFSGAMSGRTSEHGFAVGGPISPYINAGAALDALLAQEAGTLELSNDDLKQTSVAVSQAARTLSVTDTQLLPRIQALLHGLQDPIIPTRDAPVRSTDGLKRLVVSLQTDELNRTPASEVKAHPAGSDFPGPVPADAPRVSVNVDIDTAVPRWHSTGLYAAPGEKITVTVPPTAAGQGLSLRVGAHQDGIWPRADWWRFPEITRSFSVDTTTTLGACAFGGLIYVDVPNNCTLGRISVSIEGAVRAPLYLQGTTDNDAWRDTIRHAPGPWAEVGNSKVIITVPAEFVRDLDDPDDLMTFWETVMDACADLSVRERDRRSPERYVSDRQISVGYMHAGYPIMTFLDAAPRFVNVASLRSKGDWGMFHEMGHNHQSGDWTFGGTGEVTVNLFSLYILETCCPGAPVHEAVSVANIQKRIQQHLVAKGADFNVWRGDPFTALVMYIQLQQAFGWEAYKTVFAEYRGLPQDQRPRSDDDKRDQWMVRMSRTVGHDLGPFFQAWGVPTSEAARTSIQDLPVWMPEAFPPEQG